jgi:hypothetical protein
MKPTNFETETCESKSANCIIWPGPDIPCIDLKKGQNVSWAIYTLATKVCELESQLSVDSYNLGNMTAEYGPVPDFTTLIRNLLIKVYQ